MVTDLTSDGQVLLMVDGKLKIYKNVNDIFILSQELPNSTPYAGAITDDHEWVVFGTHTGNIHIYKLSGESYFEDQTFNLPNEQARDIALTQDHSFLVIGNVVNNVFVYKHDGTKFNLLQTLTFTSSSHKMVSITNDHQLLTVTDRNSD